MNASSQKTYDVVIVGAGPAGSVLGYMLAGKGIDVLIIEKQKLPRYKACGGGLTAKAIEILPFDISGVIEAYTYSAEICINDSPVFYKTLPCPAISMVMRDRFDHFLAEKAVAQGASLMDGTAFNSLSGIPGNLVIETTKGTFNTRLLVGADGVNSRTSESLGLRIRRKTMIALEGEVYFKTIDALNSFRQKICFDFGVIPKGYGWIFPKADHLSVGVLTTLKKAGHLKQHFYSYLKTKRLYSDTETRYLKGHRIPYNPDKKNIYANEKGLVVGDATGFTDPVTGEGIYYAIKEALIASDIIHKAVQADITHLNEYTADLNKEFFKEMTCAARFANVLYNCPALSHKILEAHGTKLGEYHLDIISGRKTYGELYKKLFNLPGFFSMLKKTFFSLPKRNIK